MQKNIQKLNNKITLPIMEFVWQHNGIIHILAVKASVQPWWPNKTINLSLHVCVKTLHTEALLQGPKHMKKENIYFQSWTSLLLMKQQVIFGFMLWQPWYQHLMRLFCSHCAKAYFYTSSNIMQHAFELHPLNPKSQ